MNKTLELITSTVASSGMLPDENSQAKEAIEYFKKKYEGITYNATTDTFIYRDVEFDYFLSGSCIPLDDSNPTGRHNGYLLVDKEFSDLWLCDYDDPEDMWQQYLKHKKMQQKLYAYTPPKVSWLEKLLRKIGL